MRRWLPGSPPGWRGPGLCEPFFRRCGCRRGKGPRRVREGALCQPRDGPNASYRLTHNTDFGDSWEREGVDRRYLLTFSVQGYAFGINVLVYAMTH
jgi:hypothetical protein